MTPGDIMLHHRGTCVGIVSDDGLLYTHNMDLDDSQAVNFRAVTAAEVPPDLAGFLVAARRRAARKLRFGERG